MTNMQPILNEKDREIIHILQSEGRLSNLELAERVHLSPSPCLRRLRNLEKIGVITGYAAQVDEKLFGLSITVFARIRLANHATDTVQSFESAIEKQPNVLECYLITGDYDYLLRILTDSLETYEDIMRNQLQPLPGVASIDTSFAFGQIKRTQVFPPVA